ncbi:DUF1259 domain-containing protein [Pannonibacter phragmitetus]|uniref:DUF1259 domain-containing protein n=1 Tax=Pannonibacter phragmitetus TaxID=121719 RepID=UPI000E670977|nr:DUF1259 domain-containing protein [Pannonibacter phragmitetus]
MTSGIEADRDSIEGIVGVTGAIIGEVLKISVPRSEVKVSVDGFEIIPFMGLTSWAAFRKGVERTTVMGDIVLLEDELGVAVSAAVEAGLYVTALHNHFVRAQPEVLFMHIEATADAATLARGVRSILDAVKAIRDARPVASAVKELPNGIETKRLEDIIGATGEFKNGVFKFTLGRPDVPVRCSRCGGLEIDSAMGYNTWAAFQGSQERAAVCGDFAMLELEVAPVIRELRAGNIEVVAVHNHMFFEEPRIIFLHYWGIGEAAELATVLRRALDTQKHAPANEACCSS